MNRWPGLLFAAGTALSACVAAAPPGSRGGLYVALHVSLTALMLVAWRMGGGDRWMMAMGIAARLALLPVPPFTSHDVHRYLWDGHALLAGMDPYRVVPDDLPDPNWPLPGGNGQVPTLYPPLALGLFAGAAVAGPDTGLVAWKLVTTAASILTLFLCRSALNQRGASRHLALVAYSPLLVLESGIGLHVDILATTAVAAALALPRASGWWMGVGGAIKLLPLAAAPALPGNRRLHLVTTLLAVSSFYALAWMVGLQPPGSLGVFLGQWRFGSPLHALAGPAGAAILMCALPAWIWAAATCRPGLAMGILLAASPVVFPWYLCPLVPFLAARPCAAGLAWTCAMPLTYEVIDRYDADGTWAPAAWPLMVMSGAVVAGLVVDAIRATSSRSGIRCLPSALPSP